MLRIQASILHLFLRQTKLLLKALCLRSSSIYSCLKKSEMTGQKLSFLLSTRAMAKPFRYMMVKNLSVRAKLTLNTLLLRKRVLAGGRLSISVIQMMRCPTQMRILMMTWIYESENLADPPLNHP